MYDRPHVDDLNIEAPSVEQVYRDQRLALLRLAFLLCGSRSTAEDIVQTAFAAAYPRWASIDNPEGYLRRAVVNQPKESHRRRYRFRSPVRPEPVTHQPDIDEIWARVRSLPSRQRLSWCCASTEALHPHHYSTTCHPVAAAVDFVSAASNRPGEEWNTGRVEYGESSAPPNNCPNEASWLSNPVHFAMGFTRLRPSNDGGDERSDWGYHLAAHPRVSEVEVTVDRDLPFVVRTVALPARPDGPRFAGFTVASDARSVTVKLLDADGQVLSAQTTRPAG